MEKESSKVAKRNKLWAIVIGLGLALSPIHSLWLTELVTEDGVVGFFIPAFGTAVWLMGVLLFLTWNCRNWRDIDWGDKKVFIPLLVIVASIGLSGMVNGDSWQDKVSPFFMGMSLFAVYLVSRKLGSDIFLAFIPFVVIVAITVVVSGLLNPGIPTGGLITNYCASAGYLIFGAIVIQGRWQWALIAVAIIGLFFIGTLEALFIISIMVVVFLLRGDVNWQFKAITGVLIALVGLWALLRHLIPLYEGNYNLVVLLDLITGKTAVSGDTLTALTSGRFPIIVDALKNFSIIGHGYLLGIAKEGTVHNVPLIIMHQVGPLAAIAWLFVAVYCLIKTEWKYAWVALLAMCVFDHYIWTQFTPLWWVLVGVSTASNVKSDLVFNRIGQ